MAEFPTKRIINLGEQSAPQSGDYIVTDNQTNGTKKTPASALATSQALAAEVTARQQADEAEAQARTQAISAEQTAREQAIEAEQTAREEADDALTESVTALSDEVTAQGALIQNPTKTVSGEVAHFTDGAEMPAKSVIVNIEPQQSGSGTPSPDNVRPISGWESVQTSVAGKNLLENTGTSRTSAGVTYTVNDDGSVTANGTATGNYSFFPIAQFPLKAGVTYALNGCPEGGSNSTYQIAITGATGMYDTGSGATRTPTVDGIGTVRIYVYGGQTVNNLTFYPMLRLASDTDPTYEPYAGTTTPTALGRTVYGGTLDVVSGVLTVDKAIRTIEFSQGQAITVDGVFLFRFTIVGTKDADHREDFECSHFYKPTSNISQSPANGMITNQYYNGYNMCIRNDALQTSSDWNTWLTAQINNGTPVQLVYPLVTPQTYTLTPTEVNTLLGENNVWADAGAVSITYRRDINLALEQLEELLNGTETASAQSAASTAETSEA